MRGENLKYTSSMQIIIERVAIISDT